MHTCILHTFCASVYRHAHSYIFLVLFTLEKLHHRATARKGDSEDDEDDEDADAAAADGLAAAAACTAPSITSAS